MTMLNEASFAQIMESRPNNTPEHKSNEVLLVHRYTLIRETIAKLLETKGYKVIALADLPNTETNDYLGNIGLLLLEWETVQTTPGVINSIIEKYPHINIAVLARYPSNEDLSPAFSMGIKGYLSFGLSSDEFVQTLCTLERGDIVVTRDAAGGLLQDKPVKMRKRRKDGLSAREMDVLKHIGGGATNREIAQKLFISEHTVKVHLRSILNKLTLRNRQQIAAYAAHEGLVVKSDSDIPESAKKI